MKKNVKLIAAVAVVIVVLVLIIGGIGVAYWYFTQQPDEGVDTLLPDTEEEAQPSDIPVPGEDLIERGGETGPPELPF